MIKFISECAKHCSLCYNETECFECTHGYFLTESGDCQRMYNVIQFKLTYLSQWCALFYRLLQQEYVVIGHIICNM